MFFRSIKTEILFLAIGLAVVAIVATAMIGVSSTQTAGQNATGATSDILRGQARQFLTQIATAAAAQQDLVFERVKNDTNVIASYDANIHDNPALFSRTYWDFDTRITRKGGRYLNASSDISTVHIPSFVSLSEQEKKSLELSANLDFIAPTILKNNPDAAAVYVIDTQGVTRYFPNIVLGSIAPPNYDPRPDIYYKPAAPQQNPERKTVWSPLYDDVAGRGLMITATTPVYDKHGFAGIAATDLLLANIIKVITSYSPIEGSYAFLIDRNGETIAFPDIAYRDILGRPRAHGETRTDLASSSTEFSVILKGMTNGTKGFGSIHSGSREIFIAYAPLPQTGFSLGVAAEASTMLKAAGTLDTKISDSVRGTIAWRILPASAAIILIASLISILFVARIVRPVQELTRGAQEIAKGNFDYHTNIQSKNEIGLLAISFNQMSQALKQSRHELEEYSRGLETKVKQRTAELADANMRQENLLHFIAHEIKGYLTKAQGAFAAIADGDVGSASPQVEAMARTALSEVRTGVSTVMDILEGSNLKKGTVKYRREPFDFKQAVAEEAQKQRPIAEHRGIAFEVALDEGDFTLTGDEEKLRHHVIRNLIDNAIRYTPQGSIRIELARVDGTIRLSVRDTGVGIAPDDMPIIFAEGGRGKDSIKINVDSTGYGLFVAKTVVEAHGGRITAQSDGEGKGSLFVVELPAQNATGTS